MKKSKEKNGITLIALIITVIVMLILAGVSINILTSNGGLFDKTRGATEIYNKAVKNETDMISSLLNEIDKYYSIEYIDYSFIDNGFLKLLDTSGNVYISEEKIVIEDAEYKNTGIKLIKLDNIKGSRFIFDADLNWNFDFLMEQNGKICEYNEIEKKYDVLFDGKEFQDADLGASYIFFLDKDGYIYVLDEDKNMEKVSYIDDVKFKEIKFGMALSFDNSLYDLYAETKCSKDYIVKSYNYSNFIDSNGDLYKQHSCEKIDTAGAKLSNIYYSVSNMYVDDEGYLYRVDGENSGRLENGDGVFLKESEIQMVTDEDFLLKDGRFFYDYASFDERNLKIKECLGYNMHMCACLDYTNDLYVGYDESYEKVNGDIKIKKVLSDDFTPFICVSVDNELYKCVHNTLFKISNNDKIINAVALGKNREFRGVIAINSQGEIVYSLEKILAW